MVTASSKSAKVPVLVAATFSAAPTEALSAATVGATSVNDTPNEVTAVLPSALVAVTVTEYGASSSPLPDQDRERLGLADRVDLARGPIIETATSKSAKVPG